METTPADVVDFASTQDASKLVDAVNSILNRKTADTLNNMRNEVAQNIINPPSTDTQSEEIENEDI